MGTRMCLWDTLYGLSTRPQGEGEGERNERAAQLCARVTISAELYETQPAT